MYKESLLGLALLGSIVEPYLKLHVSCVVSCTVALVRIALLIRAEQRCLTWARLACVCQKPTRGFFARACLRRRRFCFAARLYMQPCTVHALALQAASTHLQKHVVEYTSQGVSNFVWACSVLDFYNQDLYAAVAKEVLSALHALRSW